LGWREASLPSNKRPKIYTTPKKGKGSELFAASEAFISWYEGHSDTKDLFVQVRGAIITILLQDVCTQITPLLPPLFSVFENGGGLLCFSDRGGDAGAFNLDSAKYLCSFHPDYAG
jgi:hypothetical protein